MSDCVCGWEDLLMWGSTNREAQEIMRRGPVAPLLSRSAAACGTVMYGQEEVQTGGAQLGTVAT